MGIVLIYLKVNKIEGPYPSPVRPSTPAHNKGFFRKKRASPHLCIWNLSFRYLDRYQLKSREINGTPSGVLRHFPLGDKGVLNFEKGRFTLPSFFFVHLWHIIWKDCQVDPIGRVRSQSYLPTGIKHKYEQMDPSGFAFAVSIQGTVFICTREKKIIARKFSILFPARI